MSHIRYIAPQLRDGRDTLPGVSPFSVSNNALPLLSYDCDCEEHWEESFRRLKSTERAYHLARTEDAPSSLIAQFNASLMRRECELHQAFLSRFRTTDEYADWRLSILDLELRWLSRCPHKMASGLPIAEINRRLDAVRAYAAGLPHSSPAEPPPEWRHIVSDILEQPPSSEVLRMVAILRHRGGDDALQSARE